jgi:hypothetical protein
VKKILIVFTLLILANNLMAIENTADLFTYDTDKVEKEFADLKKLESYLKLNPEASNLDIISAFPKLENLVNSDINCPFNHLEIAAPGKFPSFLFTFTLSAIGTYFIYGAIAGPISVAIVYFSTKKDKIETKKAIWGCITGTLIGAGIKYAVVSFM